MNTDGEDEPKVADKAFVQIGLGESDGEQGDGQDQQQRRASDGSRRKQTQSPRRSTQQFSDQVEDGGFEEPDNRRHKEGVKDDPTP